MDAWDYIDKHYGTPSLTEQGRIEQCHKEQTTEDWEKGVDPSWLDELLVKYPENDYHGLGTQDYAEYCQRKQLNSSSFEARPPQQFNSEEALPEVNMITEVRLEEETIWGFDPDAGTPEERKAVEKARHDYRKNRSWVRPSGDVLVRMQLSRAKSSDHLGFVPPATNRNFLANEWTTILR
ncbi:hypothetical protein RHGRI_005627 [Rhododendron griersonianum]|uniref:Uncharacterized protein n=1 Tax=Rhododendron griersonianum TaxID=479676 RepID=A0AAV6LE23_9ERIC|nr:hypothetical protein RHGRI_005627 [Rhododendron griersonianum]